jgi:outer membrane protein TolC
MKRRASLLLLALAVGLPAFAQAQQATRPTIPQSLSLRDAVGLALRHSPAYRQVENDRNPATWGVRNAYGSFLPRLDVGGGFGYQGAGSQIFLTDELSSPSSTRNSGYDVSMSLVVDGRTLTGPSSANASYRATEAMIVGAEINLEATVKQQYLAVLRAVAGVGLAELQLERNEEFLRLARARFDVGQNTMLEVRRAEVATGQSEVSLLQARQGVIVEKLRLFQAIGLPGPDDPSSVVLTDTFPIVEPHWDLQTVLAEADTDNPDLITRRAQADFAHASERASRMSWWFPTFSFSAGWSGFTQQFSNSQFPVDQARASSQGAVAQCQFANTQWLNPGGTPTDCSQFVLTPADEQAIIEANSVWPFQFTAQPFRASVRLSFPIFTQFSRPLAVAEAEAFTKDADEEVRARQLLVRTEVSQGYYALLASYEAIRIQENNQTAAEEQLRLAQERYRVGSGTFIELLDAQVAALMAEADYINAIYAYHQSIATLEAAVGRPLR